MSAGTVQGLSQLGGFSALGVSDAPSSYGGYVHNAVASALVGSSAAVLGGGKFTNGALTGAFSRLFNDLGSSDIWNQKARSRHIKLKRLTGVSDEEFISATAWETQSLSDGINNKAVALLRRVLGRALTVVAVQISIIVFSKLSAYFLPDRVVIICLVAALNSNYGGP